MFPVQDIKQQITEKLLQKPADKPGIQRLEIPVGDLDLLAWLYNQPFELKTYCAGRDDRFKIAGVGSACTIHADQGDFKSLFQQLTPLVNASDERIRFYGGFKFDFSTKVSAPWQSFGAYHFTVPQFEFVQRDGVTHFAVNVMQDDNTKNDAESILTDLEKLQFDASTPQQELPQYIDAKRNPDKAGWTSNVEQALELIRQEALQKIVLSGQLHLQFKDPVDSLLLFHKLIGQNSNSFHFYFQTGANNAFMGITPERLYRREGREIKSEAIAGTRPRSADAMTDAAYARELYDSDKDIREHRWVSHIIRTGLGPLCNDVHILEREQIIKLRHVQHLQTKFSGHLRDDVCDSDILSQLHPTPAVGGHPNNEAKQYITDIEGFDRGWYAGPVGWVGKDVTGFAVGIRSGLVHGNNLSLFAGSGIVEGSGPAKEWEENQTKLLNFTKLFQ